MSYADILRLSLPRQQGKSPIATTPGMILGWRKNGMPIFPIAGGSEPPVPPVPPVEPVAPPVPPAAPVEATDENGVALGFPKETRVEDMTDAQKANYWRNESKKQQKRVPANLTQLEADAAAWAEYQRKQQTPADQQIAAARAEARKEALTEASRDSALALLRVSLHNRGKTAAEVDELIEYVSPDRFLNADNMVDTSRVTTYVDKIAPAGKAGGGNTNIGQGRYEQSTPDRGAAGRAEAQRRGFTSAAKPPQVVGK